MLLHLLRFEWRFHRQHISFLAFALLFLLLGYLLSGNAFGEANLYYNATYNIHLVIGIQSLVAIFIIMVLSSRVILRDKNSKMSELIYTTPVLKWQFLGSRFLGLFLSSSLLFSFVLLGLWLGAVTATGDTGKVGPILAIHYLWPFLCLALPNLFIGSVVLFMLASLTQNALATYIGGIALYCLYWVCAIFLNSPMIAHSSPASPEGIALAALLDPFGLSAFFEQNQYWEIAERNTSLIALKGNFLWNRIGWTSLGLFLLLLNYRLFSFRKHKEKKRQAPEALPATISLASDYTQEPVTLDFTYYWQQFRSCFRLEMNQLLSSWPLGIALVLWMGIVASEIISRIYGGGEYGTSPYPTTYLMIWQIAEPYQLLSSLLIIFFGGEMMVKEQAVGIDAIRDATPSRNRIFFFAKLLSLSIIPLLLLLSAFIVAIGCQLSKGYTLLEPLQYLSMFYFLGLPLVLVVVVVLFIQTWLSNKYLGMFLCLVFLLMTTSSLSYRIGIEHPLLKINNFPTVTYNQMNGLDHLATSFHWLALYWGSFSVLLGWVCLKVWKRGTLAPFVSRLFSVFGKSKQSKKWIPITSLLFFLTSGSYIFYNTNQLNSYIDVAATLDRQADYEKKYKAFSELPEMRVIDLKSAVDLYPERRAFQITHDFILQNKTDKIINELWFSVPRGVKVNKMVISNAKLVRYDSRHQVYWFEMGKPVLPGEERLMEYDIEDDIAGFKFSHSLMDRAVVKNGTNLMSQFILPTFGYRTSEEISDNQERKKRGLATLATQGEGATHAGLEEEVFIPYSKFSFETIISTTEGQTAIAPGNLIKEWKEKDRHFFHYRTEQPINHFYSYVSANYQLHHQDHSGIKLDIYYDRAHPYNIDRMFETMAVTLDYCQSAFTPYAFEQLRIAEIPGHWPMGGYATAGTIALVENRSFLTDLRDTSSFDVVTKRVAHEVAHQWFGHQLTPINTAGASMLVESTAKYIECVILEKQSGKDQLRQLLKTEMDRYFSARNRSLLIEPPLDKVDEQGFISYSKGGIVMNALRDLLGEDSLNIIIRQLFELHAYPKPKATAADFVQLLYAGSPKEKHAQIEDWVSKVVIYDNKLVAIQHQRLANGQYEITATIKAKKQALAADGSLHEVPMAETINIGLFQVHPDKLKRLSAHNVLQKHFIQPGEQKLILRTEVLPKYIVVDPYLHLMDKNIVDNVMAF